MVAEDDTPRAADAAEAAAFFVAVLAYLWLLAIPAPWSIVLLIGAVFHSWRRRKLRAVDLGLTWRQFAACWRQWSWLWVPAFACFVVLGGHRLWQVRALADGAAYFAWSAVQMAVYQSMTYLPLRGSLKNHRLAGVLAGVAFALVHAPNPVLIPATLVWGAAASLLFERCRSVWGLALLQTLFSSMLLWLAPPELSRSFRIGPYYFRSRSGAPEPGSMVPPVLVEPVEPWKGL